MMLPIALALVASAVSAEDGAVSVTDTAIVEYAAEAFEGSQYREALTEALGLRRDAKKKWAALQPALDFCDTKHDSPTRAWVAVSTKEERAELLATRADAAKLAFVDIACPQAYTMAGFFAADDGQVDRAIGLLERAQQLGPFLASPHSERGFLFNAAGDRQQALASYRRALDLAERYPSALSHKPIALRGLGWTLIEMGDYAGARQAYEQSLLLEPGNKNAIGELAFIAGMEKKGLASPDSPAFSPKVTKGKDDGQPALAPDKERVVAYTRVLESQPLRTDAKAIRSWLLAWIEAAPDVSVTVCDTLGILGDDSAAFGSELFAQSIFGMAAFLIEHPGAKDDRDAQQLAGVESALRAYTALLLERPEARIKPLDTLLQHQAAGDLAAHLAPVLRSKCSG